VHPGEGEVQDAWLEGLRSGAAHAARVTTPCAGRAEDPLALEVSVTVIDGDDHHAPALLVQVVDVTERAAEHPHDAEARRRAEEQLERTTAELEQRNAELERSNTDLQQFAYVASHDLSEPLRVVTGYLELISRRYAGRLDADADQFIHFTLDAVERMQALIRDLLAYSRVETEAREFEPVDVARLMEHVLAGLGRTIRERGADVEIGELPVVEADGSQLARVFQNLLANALKFTRDVSPSVRVSATRVPNAWQFSVVDNGIGIEPRHRERIFQMFQRLHPRDAYPGTGIGLAICKRVVERHGGRIWAEEAPGGGSAFHFTVADA